MSDKSATADVSRTPELLSVVEGDLRDPATVDDVAAAWSDALAERGDDPALRRNFERWYGEDIAHAAAFDRIDAAYRKLRASIAGGAGKLRALENDTLARLAVKAKRERRRRRIRRLSMAAAAGVVVAAVTGIGFVTGGSWQELRYLPERLQYALTGDTLYRTDVGERLTATLDDGTVLTLNTASRAVVDYGENTRGVRLLEGQALFEVARDQTRPFEVQAAGRRITALGTAFDVRVTGGNLEVTLIEGKVSVEDDTPEPAATASTDHSQATGHKPQATNHKPQPTILAPGQQLIIAAATPAESIVREADIRRIISWRDGQILFEDEPLIYALEEINRYSKRRVVLADEDLAELRVSGAFNASKTEVFVEMLTKYFPIRIVETDEDRIVLGHKS
jgi:transmembrane sensor